MERIKKLKEILDNKNVKFKFNKDGNRIIFTRIEKKDYIQICLECKFWQKDNWKHYKKIEERKKLSYDNQKNIKEFKLSLIKEILEKAIKIF